MTNVFFKRAAGLLHSRAYRAESPYTTLWGLGRIWRARPDLRPSIEANLAQRVIQGKITDLFVIDDFSAEAWMGVLRKINTQEMLQTSDQFIELYKKMVDKILKDRKEDLHEIFLFCLRVFDSDSATLKYFMCKIERGIENTDSAINTAINIEFIARDMDAAEALLKRLQVLDLSSLTNGQQTRLLEASCPKVVIALAEKMPQRFADNDELQIKLGEALCGMPILLTAERLKCILLYLGHLGGAFTGKYVINILTEQMAVYLWDTHKIHFAIATDVFGDDIMKQHYDGGQIEASTEMIQLSGWSSSFSNLSDSEAHNRHKIMAGNCLRAMMRQADVNVPVNLLDPWGRTIVF
jgi:hypothetical protein